MASDAMEIDGFRWAGIRCGLKQAKRPDLGLIVADEVVPVAAVLTQNVVRAAPVELAAKRLVRGCARAILVNSGNANACTGRPGMKAAERTTAAVAAALGIPVNLVLPASTGIIGQVLDAERVVKAVPKLVRGASSSGAPDFARAILTTDAGPKICTSTVGPARARRPRVLGIAKGAGMIHPQLATTLVFVVTDALVGAATLAAALSIASDRTFNRISVDGDTSTNDAIFALASGRAMNTEIEQGGGAFKHLVQALSEVLGGLGEMIVADGEGAEHCVRIEVRGLAIEEDALRVARAIATSLLVKTALHGCDPNWGRILAAAGTAGVAFIPERAAIAVGDVVLVRKGVGVGGTAEGAARRIMRRPKYDITVTLGTGRGRASYLTSDIGHEYVRVNADYHT